MDEKMKALRVFPELVYGLFMKTISRRNLPKPSSRGLMLKMRFTRTALNYWKQNRRYEWSRVRNLCTPELGKSSQ